jgi:hypothetical protein
MKPGTPILRSTRLLDQLRERIAGSQRCAHHHDLHTRGEGSGRRHGKSVGLIGLWRLSDGFGREGSMALQGRVESTALVGTGR